MRRLNVCMPDWQSAGADRTLYHGAQFLKTCLADRVDFVELPVPIDRKPVRRHGVIGHSDVVTQLQRFGRTIDQAEPETLFTVGGTCGMEVVPISYLNRRHDRNLTVIWFDAHADLNTPESSPSGTFHGMPLRVLLGEGDQALRATAYSTLHPDQVVLAGVRDLDPDELAVIERHRIAQVSVASLARPEALSQSIDATGNTKLYVHLDFDVLDPAEFPHAYVPTPDGASVERLADTIRFLAERYTIVGASMVELAPQGAGPRNEVNEAVRGVVVVALPPTVACCSARARQTGTYPDCPRRLDAAARLPAQPRRPRGESGWRARRCSSAPVAARFLLRSTPRR